MDECSRKWLLYCTGTSRRCIAAVNRGTMCVSMANASAALAPGLSMGLDIPPLFNSLVASETGPRATTRVLLCALQLGKGNEEVCVCVYSPDAHSCQLSYLLHVAPCMQAQDNLMTSQCMANKGIICYKHALLVKPSESNVRTLAYHCRINVSWLFLLQI